jgi:hypothetical protein
MIATALPTRSAAARTIAARSMWSCAVPCEKFSRTTSTPAAIRRCITSGEDEAGPRVATILVRRVMGGAFSGDSRLSAPHRPCQFRLSFTSVPVGFASEQGQSAGQ